LKLKFLHELAAQRIGTFKFTALAVSQGERVMVNTAFQDWRRECEAVQKEMDRLITAGRPQSPEERQVRQLQFSALIERRDAAARNLLRASVRPAK